MKTGRQACCCVTTVSLPELTKWTEIWIFFFFTNFVSDWQSKSLCVLGSRKLLFRKLTEPSDLSCLFSFLFQISVTTKRFVRLTAPHPWSIPTPLTSTSAGTRCPMPSVGFRSCHWPGWSFAVTMVTPCRHKHPLGLWDYLRLCALMRSSQLCLAWKSAVWVIHKTRL